MRVWPGKPYPLGATWDGRGVNFALFSASATGVELCLFDQPDAPKEVLRIQFVERSDHVWHAYLPDTRPGQLYGYRVHGPSDYGHGHRFNPAKLLIDPYAHAVSGPVMWGEELFGYRRVGGIPTRLPDDRDSAHLVPKSVVVDHAFSWGDDRRPRTPWSSSIIYECHVRGMSIVHPDVPPEIRGTYLGMASDPIIDHLQALGVTAVELLPVHQSLDEHHLVLKGLSNYWGYSPIGYFAPNVRYATAPGGTSVYEFKTMVRALHRAGIEVILDVVYNHTGEGNELGPTLSLRGIDNGSYYHLVPDNPHQYLDFTGTGNSLSMHHPRALQMVVDSMRYWAVRMHVDGFRLDLATVLGRDRYSFNPLAPFFRVVQQDPVLSQLKLIAEPWDLGVGGYQVGNFPAGWAEWNDRYRNCVRRFWRGDPGQVPELASRLSGSSDIYEHSGRGPYASVNYVTSHDGFTLHDLVSYSHKHNLANHEDNHDGSDDNFSSNWGEEGPTSSARISQARQRIKRNLIATLLFSQGARMVLGGDEIGRTQQGNNNAYCQDNEVSWVDWEQADKELLEFTKQARAALKEHPILRRRRFFTHGDVNEVLWLRPDGGKMEARDWQDPTNQVLGMLIPGQATDEVDEAGRVLYGDTLLLLLNGGGSSVYFALPEPHPFGGWQELLNTARPGTHRARKGGLNLGTHSLILLSYGDRGAFPLQPW
jgi:isoamylase